ncbi:hypothetical protein [Mycobacterium heckeshornense]|uniref:hypothetical protein n=1 Tax=Mycobacterium heckeshornense TaxID=110505 RepID=UPI001156AC10|nr:hypothetical protein [Mycobacterium heckeshornense]MCV7035290.1 hypothetical protein [Mycobacterium heckeshornense]
MKQPDDSSSTAVSVAANATAFSAFTMLVIGLPSLLVVVHVRNRDASAVTFAVTLFLTFV